MRTTAAAGAARHIAFARWMLMTCAIALAGVAIAATGVRVESVAASPAVKSPGGIVPVVEFYNAGLTHYFISADPAEIAVLDGGAFGGAWVRTGRSFSAWDIAGAPADTLPVCRFFGTDRYRADGSRIGPNSHFYTADPAECAYVKVSYQAVASDGNSYPAWTYESNAFAVKALVGGACPAGTLPLYRSYNNGMRGDPGHRYSTDASVLQAMTGWVFEGLTMCVPPTDGPAVTAVGVPAGTPTSAVVGSAGGTLAAADGKLTLTIPPGALAAPTTIGIQPVSNFAPGAIGGAYRLTPDGQQFQMPITLTFAYADPDLAGTAVEALGAAFQRGEGTWEWLGDATPDPVAKTVSVSSNHFTIFSPVKGAHILPWTASVKPSGTVALQVKTCYGVDPSSGDLASLGYNCDAGQGPLNGSVVDQWSVNSTPGGGGVFGTVAGSGVTATYRAPTNEPTPNTVAVSARVKLPKGTRTFLVVSNITITEGSWSGTASGTNLDVTTTAHVVWTLESRVNNVAIYKGTGTATSTISGGVCAGGSFSPPTWPIDASISVATLTIDFNATPPTYHGSAVTEWSAGLTCLGMTAAAIGGGPWFGGGGAGNEATGVVSPDGNTIQGSALDRLSPPTSFTWSFTRNP